MGEGDDLCVTRAQGAVDRRYPVEATLTGDAGFGNPKCLISAKI